MAKWSIYRNETATPSQIFFVFQFSFIQVLGTQFLFHFRLYLVRERSHMTSAAEGGGGFEMLTVADKGGGEGV